MANPSLDLATFLSGQSLTFGVTAIVLNTNLFPGPQRIAAGKYPQECLFVTEYGGLPPEDTFGSTSPTFPSTVQVMVRGAAGDYATARTTARATLAVTHKATVANYWSIRCNQSEPIYLGQDDIECHKFSINVTMRSGSV